MDKTFEKQGVQIALLVWLYINRHSHTGVSHCSHKNMPVMQILLNSTLLPVQ